MSCEAVGYLTIMQLTANVYLVVARPCRSGWSLWLNQLAGFIRVFQEDIDVRGEVSSNYLGLGFCVSQRYFLFRMAELFSLSVLFLREDVWILW